MITEIRCSSLARPMVCAGSLAFKDLMEQEAGDPAKEGTAAGELLALKLTCPPGQPISRQATNGIYFDDDMEFYTEPIARRLRAKAVGPILCEQRIDWRTRSGIIIRGSYDISFECANNWLHIPDLKYGWGIHEVFEHWQLLGYAIGEVIRRQKVYEKIVLSIEQPRPHHEEGSSREWVLTFAELLEYKERIEARMDEIAAGAKDLQTSPKCKYCPAAAEACPAFNRLYYRGLEVAYGFTQDYIDDATLARQLDEVARAEEVLKIKRDSIQQLATQRINQGKVIPGWSTEKQYGHRAWRPGITSEVIKTLTGIEVVEKSMLSPAKAEKLGIDKNFINALVDKRFIGNKLIKKDGSDIGNKIFGAEAPKGVSNV